MASEFVCSTQNEWERNAHARAHVGHLVVLHVQQRLHQAVRLGDQLHVAVLDAVVHHLHEVARALGPDPLAAGRAVQGLRSYALHTVHRSPINLRVHLLVHDTSTSLTRKALRAPHDEPH